MIDEWFKQLFGERRQDGKGLATVIFSADLHSLGQFIQEGARNLFETVVDIQKPVQDFFIKEDPKLDRLNFLSGQNMSVVNRRRYRAHPCAPKACPTWCWSPEINPYEYGYMVYFFERPARSRAISSG
ncbi:MAG: hypothetical protein ACLSAP_11020 [Oscillospiraceae bacterium]